MTTTIDNATTIHELTTALRGLLSTETMEDLAGMIPSRFCDPDTMPDDADWLLAWTDTHEVRFGPGAADGVIGCSARESTQAATG